MELSPLHNSGMVPVNNPSIASAGPNTKTTTTISDNYIPPDIRDPRDLHRPETISETTAIPKTPRVLNAGAQIFSKVFRYVFWGGAAICGSLAAAALFLINPTVAFLFALPAAGCLAAYVALKPQEDLSYTLHDDQDVNTLMTAATDEEIGKPEIIGSPELLKSVEKIGRAWGSLPVNREQTDKNLRYEKYLRVYYYLEKLKSKLLPIIETCSNGTTIPGVTLAALKRLQDSATNVSQDMAGYLKNKGVRLEEAHS